MPNPGDTLRQYRINFFLVQPCHPVQIWKQRCRNAFGIHILSYPLLEEQSKGDKDAGVDFGSGRAIRSP